MTIRIVNFIISRISVFLHILWRTGYSSRRKNYDGCLSSATYACTLCIRGKVIELENFNLHRNCNNFHAN